MSLPRTPSPDDIRLAVLDLAGTTVTDAGAVEEAFSRALRRAGVVERSERWARMTEHIRATMGESKIAVFRHLFGDDRAAQETNLAFEEAYAELVADGRCRPIPGARAAVEELRSAGVAVVLNTGFSPRTRDGLLSALGWQDLADAVLSPADAGRGRPYPDMVLTALLRTEAPSVRQTVVVGDTPYDMEAGLRAGAGLVVGVLTGAHDKDDLRTAGAHHVLDSVAQLPGLLRER
ncbi:phosphonatase-like hydrolase [Streptomyces cavernicola]|uniref:Phosphonatase-like hydrolase n=1 Tax=Streptomyces cavernicola TaxID=3043613 RepID=A0ABT6SCG2_9ACTN|nr:phosphonatase-like hydrolase [Streptomyces sp. B-S-A6]MDI3405659.1 phosphonatase-like hydrolase [Streptomyces sp. B-S-A6]